MKYLILDYLEATASRLPEKTAFVDAESSVSFGELTVDLRGCESVSEDCTITANCSFGELEILVPRRYRAMPESNTTFASMSVEGEPDPHPAATLYIEGNVTFGEITVKYI